MWEFVADVFGLTGWSAYSNNTTAASAVRSVETNSVRSIARMLDHTSKWKNRHNDPYNHIIAVDGTLSHSKPSLYLGSVKTLHEQPTFMENIGAVVSIIDSDRFPKKLLLHYIRPPVNGVKKGYL